MMNWAQTYDIMAMLWVMLDLRYTAGSKPNKSEGLNTLGYMPTSWSNLSEA